MFIRYSEMITFHNLNYRGQSRLDQRIPYDVSGAWSFYFHSLQMALCIPCALFQSNNR